MKVGDKVKYDGEKHLVVNILKDGSPVLVPMSVIDDECYAVDLDELGLGLSSEDNNFSVL